MLPDQGHLKCCDNRNCLSDSRFPAERATGNNSMSAVPVVSMIHLAGTELAVPALSEGL